MIYEWTPDLRDIVERARKVRDKVRGMYLLVNRIGQPYSADGFRTLWGRVRDKAIKDNLIAERFTFHDIRAKAGSDSEDERLLGHVDAQTLRRHYQRKPFKVTPIPPKVLDNR